MSGSEAIISAVIGVLLPLIISVIKPLSWPANAKLLLTASVSLVIAMGVQAIQGGIDGGGLALNWAEIFGVATVVYRAILEKVPVEEALRKLGTPRIR